MKQRKKVVVLGKGSLAIRISDWFFNSNEYDLIYTVPVIPEPTWTDSFKNWSSSKNIPTIDSGDYNDITGINSNDWKVDLCFSVFYDKIIKEWFIKKCEQILNLHNAPLPRYRGVRPINWALKNNEKKHGVTIHEITPGIDDGPIISQLEYSIYPYFDEVIDVYKRALEYGWILFLQTIPVLEKITPKKQDESMATYYSTKENHLLGERAGFTKQISLK